MIAAFLDLPWYVRAFVVAYVLIGLAIVGLLVWARWFPLNLDYQCECCGDEPRVPTVYGDDR